MNSIIGDVHASYWFYRWQFYWWMLITISLCFVSLMNFLHFLMVLTDDKIALCSFQILFWVIPMHVSIFSTKHSILNHSNSKPIRFRKKANFLQINLFRHFLFDSIENHLSLLLIHFILNYFTIDSLGRAQVPLFDFTIKCFCHLAALTRTCSRMSSVLGNHLIW